MIIIMERSATLSNRDRVIGLLEENGFKTKVDIGEIFTAIQAFGDKTTVTPGRIAALEGVKEVKEIREPFRLASRDFQAEDTVITFRNGVKIGGGGKCIGATDTSGEESCKPVIMAGPCSIEDYEGLLKVAVAVKEAGGEFLRGGAFKPRTSPYDFQGYEEKALEYMRKAGEQTGLLTVTEVMDACDLDMICDYVDVVQIGARNVQNFKLLKAAGKCNKPVLLKRGLSSTIKEFLLAAEHILYQGNRNVILCERGIRSFDEQYTRNVMDIAAIPVIKKLSHLPIIVDPSHGTGQRYLVEPMTKAGLVVGAHGAMIEVHHDPENAMSDGKQSLPIEAFKEIMVRLGDRQFLC